MALRSHTIHGKIQVDYATYWPVKRVPKHMLKDGQGFFFSYQFDKGYVATVTHVVAAADGLPKVIISYAASTMTKEQGELVDPWKDDKLKMMMRLSRLRARSIPEDLKLFGWNSLKEPLPPECDPDH